MPPQTAVSLSRSQYICFGSTFLVAGVHEFIVLPERGLLARKLDPLFDEQLAIRILCVDQARADEVVPLAVGEDLAVETEDSDVKIPIVETTALGCELCVRPIRALLPYEAHRLLHHSDCFLLGGKLGG